MDLSKYETEVVTPRGGGAPYTVVLIPSDSTPGKTYRLDLIGKRCSCPGWINRRTCKHITRIFHS